MKYDNAVAKFLGLMALIVEPRGSPSPDKNTFKHISDYSFFLA